MKDFEVAMLSTLQEKSTLWVFAYGSLLWKPSFHFHRQLVGHIKGFKRRFFQGNTNLRGSASQPGRVAILVPDEQEVTWGVAYEIRGQQHVQWALEHLYVRENSKGGYHTIFCTFHPRSPSAWDSGDCDGDVTALSSSSSSEPITVMVFTATSSSQLYMGPADVSTMARQVVAARGHAGTNAEYVLRTAEFVREHIPEDQDPHLFDLEGTIRELLSAAAATAAAAAVTAATAAAAEAQRTPMGSVHPDSPATAPSLRAVTMPV